MFSFRKKHKYTAYHDKNKTHNYTLDSDDDHESESFLNDDFEDIPSDENNDDFPQSYPGSGRDRAGKHYNNSTSHSSTATSIVSVSVINDSKNTRKSTFSAPDPEIDDAIDAKKKKIGEYKCKSKDNKKSGSKNKDKGKFMSRMMSAIKSKTSKFGKNKKGKYDKQSSGERSITPLTTSDDESDYE